MNSSSDREIIAEVYSWYRLTSDSLLERQEQVIAGSIDSDFFGMSVVDIKELFQQLKDELEKAYILKLVATAEAIFVHDFKNKASKGKRWRNRTLEDKFRKIYNGKSHPRFISLEHDIIEIWRLHGSISDPEMLSRFKSLIKLRHWLAHGKYWPYKGQPFSIDDSLTIVREALVTCYL